MTTHHRGRAMALLAAGSLFGAGLLVTSPAPADEPLEDGAAAAAPGEQSLGHEPKHPLKIKAKRDAMREAALVRKLKGKPAYPKGYKGSEVPLELEGTDKIFVVLA